MKLVSSLALFSALNLLIINTTLAAPSNPCKRDGSLKEWAIKKGYSSETCGTTPESTNQAPTVSITAPTDNLVTEEGTALLFQADAEDLEDGMISNNVVWHSSIDGNIGNFTTLSVGQHTITATITDTGGLVNQDAIILEITALPEVINYSASLQWQAPNARENGDALYSEDVAGYIITVTESATGESRIIEVNDGLATSQIIDDLNTGNYGFALQTKDVNGLVSEASSPVYIDINP